MSSIQVQAWQVDQFGRTVRMRAEQRSARMLAATVEEPFEGGEQFSVDLFKSAEDAPQEVTSLLTDTPINNEEYTRRWGVMRTYDQGSLLDKQQKVKLLTNPQSKLVMAHAMTMSRGIDDTIIDALGGSVLQGKKSGQLSTVAFPAGQEIAASGTGLTISKLIAAKELFNSRDVDEDTPRYWYCGSKQITNLLEEEKITSADYAAVKALVEGRVNSFMGFEFVRTERLGLNGTVRDNFAALQGSISWAWGQRPTSYIDVRPDKRRATQVYTDGSWGAVRHEDELVIRVLCDEA